MVDKPAVPFSVRYQNPADAVLRRDDHALLLGAVGYGADRPGFLHADCPFIRAPLRPVAAGGMLEIWRASAPVRPFQRGPVVGVCNDDVAFGTLRLLQGDDRPLEDSVEDAYLKIFDFMEAAGFTAPLRFWNYLTSITADDGGLERYMRFNIGRHRAFSARLRQPVPPAASGVGGCQGDSIIYFLAGRTPATPIENPRQISAYHYPEVYGPSSPSFSRASVWTGSGAEALFISGTASIVGHETRHIDDVNGQIAETAENIWALIEAAALAGAVSTNGVWSSKIYLKNPDDLAAVSRAVDEIFGAHSERLFLLADICRKGLSLEIEAFRHASV